jgi:predicted RNase H-like HicB family nuclease
MVKKVKVQTLYGVYECNFSSDSKEPGYTVTVPTLRGIVTEGRTLPEAKRMAREAIELHCEALLASKMARVVPLERGRA